MEELKDDFINISKEVRDHLHTEIKLVKIEVTDHLSHFLASILSRVFLFVFVVITYVFLCVSAALYLGQFMALWMGFGVMALFSLLVLLVAYFLRDRVLQGPIQDFFIRVLALKFNLK